MASLIEDYCREAGVRNLQKHLEKIYRKVALKLAKEKGPEASKRVGDSRAKLLSAKKQVADKEEELRVAKITNGTEPKPAKSGGGKTKNTKESSLDSLSAALAELRDLVLSNEKDVHAALALTAVQDPVVVNAGADLVQYVGKYFPITTFRLCDCPYETDTFFFIVLGQPPFQTDRIYDKTPPGVVTGLAWTSMGGSTLYIECTGIHQNAVNDFDDDEMEDGDGDDDYKRTAPKKKGESSKRKNKLVGGSRKTVGGTLKTTGQLGDVMTESATIAHTFAKNFVALRHPGNDYFDVTKLHLHVPAGSTPKVVIGAFTKSRTTVCPYKTDTFFYLSQGRAERGVHDGHGDGEFGDGQGGPAEPRDDGRGDAYRNRHADWRRQGENNRRPPKRRHAHPVPRRQQKRLPRTQRRSKARPGSFLREDVRRRVQTRAGVGCGRVNGKTL